MGILGYRQWGGAPRSIGSIPEKQIIGLTLSRRAGAAKHEYHIVSNAGHFAFLGPCPPALATEAPQICHDAGGFDRVAFHRQFNADVLTFLRAHLSSAPR